jgi:hypothetical protein
MLTYLSTLSATKRNEIDFMFEGKPYTINEDDCTSHSGVWTDSNGGECTLDVTPELCAAAHGTWFAKNGGGCTVARDGHDLGSVVEPSSNIPVRDLTAMKGHGDVAAMNMLGLVLGVGVGVLLLTLVNGVRAAWAKREDAEGGYKDIKNYPGQERIGMHQRL